ncbi:MAG: diguanylate cyclase [Anaerolineales bacterium]
MPYSSRLRATWLFFGGLSLLILGAVAIVRYFFGPPAGMVIALPVILFAWWRGLGWALSLGVLDFLTYLLLSLVLQRGAYTGDAVAAHLVGLTLVSAVAVFAVRMKQDQRRVQQAVLLQAERTQQQLDQIDFLSMLNDVVSAALEADDMLAMLRMLAQRVGKLFRADDCFITRWDEKKQAPIPTAAYGRLSETYATVQPLPGETSLTQAVLEAGRPLALEDVRHAACIGPNLARDFPSASALGLPLISGARRLGAVILGFRQPHHFTEDEIRRGELTARQISLAMTKVLLLEEARARVRELAGLHMISQTFSLYPDSEICGSLTDILADLFQAEICVIGLCEETGKFIQFQSPGHGVSEEILRAIRYPCEMGARAWDFSRGVFCANSPADIPADFAEMAASLGVRSILVAPLWNLEHKLMGAIYVANRLGGFNDNDIHLAEILAEQVAGVLRNTRLLAAERRRARELAVLHAIAALANDVNDEDELLERATELIGHDIYPDYVAILLLDEKRQELYVHSSYHQTKREGQIRVPLDLGIVGAVARSGKPRNVPEVSQAPDYLSVDPLTRSELCVPLKAGDKVIGVLNVESREPNHFRREDEELLGILAGQLSTAIQRLRTVRAEEHQRLQTERSNALFKALVQVGASAAAASDLNGVFRALGNELSKLGLHCIVALIDGQGAHAVIRYTSLPPQAVRQAERLSGYRMTDYAVPLETLEAFVSQIPSSVFIREPFQVARSLLPHIPHHKLSKILKALGIAENVVMCHLPLVSEGQMLGVIWLWGEGFREGDLQAMLLFARQVASALQNANLLEEVRRLAITDDLTGLHNRRYFFEQGERQFQRAKRQGQALAALILDVDYFKSVNDQYGHQVGDEVLRSIARRLRSTLRETDLLGRYGGEEFSALLPGADIETAMEVAERVHAAITAEPIPTEAGLLSVQVSIGVSALDEKIANLHDMIKRADQAMYAAKESGRNCVAMK